MAILDMNRMAAVGAATQLPLTGAAHAACDDLVDVPFLSRLELEAILGNPRPMPDASPVLPAPRRCRAPVDLRMLEAA